MYQATGKCAYTRKSLECIARDGECKRGHFFDLAAGEPKK